MGELTEDQKQKALEIALDGATEEEKQILEDLQRATRFIRANSEIPGKLIHPKEGSEEAAKLIHNHTHLPPELETGPQKTVRLLEEAIKRLTPQLVELEGEERLELGSLLTEMRSHIDYGVIAPDEYEMATIWLAQQSGKPLRMVRRVLKNKLGIERKK